MNEEQFEQLVNLVLALHSAAAKAGMSLIDGSTPPQMDEAYGRASDARQAIYAFVAEMMEGN